MKDSSRITIDEFLQVRYGGIWAPVAGHLGSKNYASRHTFFSRRCSGARDRCLDPPKLRQMHQRWAKCDLKSKFTVAASKSPDARPAGEYISHPSLPPASFAGSFFSSFFSFFFFFLFLFSSACPSRFEHRPTWKWVKRSVHLDLNHFALEILFRSALNLAFRAKHDREKSFSSPVSDGKRQDGRRILLFTATFLHKSFEKPLKAARYGGWI